MLEEHLQDWISIDKRHFLETSFKGNDGESYASHFTHIRAVTPFSECRVYKFRYPILMMLQIIHVLVQLLIRDNTAWWLECHLQNYMPITIHGELKPPARLFMPQITHILCIRSVVFIFSRPPQPLCCWTLNYNHIHLSISGEFRIIYFEMKF